MAKQKHNKRAVNNTGVRLRHRRTPDNTVKAQSALTLENSYYDTATINTREDVIAIANHIITNNDLDTKHFIALKNRVKASSSPGLVKLLFEDLIISTFSPRRHTIDNNKFKRHSQLQNSVEWTDRIRLYPITETINLSDIKFMAGRICYKDREFKSGIVHEIPRFILGLINRRITVSITSKDSFHLEPYSLLNEIMKAVPETIERLSLETERTVMESFLDEVRKSYPELSIHSLIRLKDVTFKDGKAEFDMNSSNIIKYHNPQKWYYYDYRRRVQELWNKTYGRFGVQPLPLSISQSLFRDRIRDAEMEYVKGLSHHCCLELNQNSTSLFLSQTIRVVFKNENCMPAYATYSNAQQAHDAAPERIPEPKIRSYSFSETDLDMIMSICAESEDSQEYDDIYRDPSETGYRYYRGIKHEIQKRVQDIKADRVVRGILDLSEFEYRPPFLSNGIPLLIWECNWHESDSLYNTGEGPTRVVLKVQDNHIVMYPVDAKKAIYHFGIEPEKKNLAVFFLWAYFNSYKNNRREKIWEILDYAHNFGVVSFVKQENIRA